MKKYDVIIVGGGTAGSSCAYNAAKLGLKTLLIEKNSFLGGSITSSLVVPAMKMSKNAINTSFYKLLYDSLYEIDGAITYSDGNIGWFNPELVKITLDSLMKSVGVDVLFETLVKDITFKDNKILSVYIDTIDGDNLFYKNSGLLEPIETRYLVDATGDAKICKKLNCKFLGKLNKFQPASLRFIMSGVDVETFSTWIMELDDNRNNTSACRKNGRMYLSTAYTWESNISWALRPVFKRAIADGIITEDDANYFQIFSVAGTNGSIAFNAPRILNEIKNRSKTYIEARESILRLSMFCKKYLPGFESSWISSIANSLGERETNRVQGKYVFSSRDLTTGKVFVNPVLVSDYPIDIHSSQKDGSVLQKPTKEYQFPLESMMVQDWDNLFVAGRCVSADFEAQAAIRVIPSCFSMGEGLAKYLAKQ